MSATYTVKQVAEILGYSTNSIYTFLREKRIKGVRVGKGRFRIPVGEVDRLLQVKGAIVQSPLSPIINTPLVAKIASSAGSDLRHEPQASYNIMVPSLFDWFISITSIVFGCSLFLFSRVNTQNAIEPFMPWLTPLRVGFIAGSLGLLYASVRGRKEALWHGVFLSVLGACYGFIAVTVFIAGDYDGIVIYGALSILIFIHFLANLRSITSFTLYVGAIMVLLPIAYVFSPRWALLTTGWASYWTNPILDGVGIIVGALLYFAVLFWAFRKHRILFWILLSTNAVIFIMIALAYAGQLSWGRAFFFLIIAFTSLFVPVWESFQFTHRRQRIEIFVLFGLILGLFLITIFVVGSVQNIILDFTGRQLVNKVGYGRLLVESTIETSQTAVERLAEHPMLTAAIEKGDVPKMNDIMRGFFDGGTQLRRFVVLTPAGDAIAVYPFDTLVEGKNFAGRDYFKDVLQNKKTYITDVFIAVTGVPTIIFATPVLTSQGEILGVILGALDIDKLGDRLQRLADAGSMEYFVVADRAGNRVVTPNVELFNTPLEEHSGIRKGILGLRGSGIVYGSIGQQVLQAYDTIPVTSWGIGVNVPVMVLLRPTQTGLIVIGTLVILSSLIVIGYLVYRRPRIAMPIDSS